MAEPSSGMKMRLSLAARVLGLCLILGTLGLVAYEVGQWSTSIGKPRDTYRDGEFPVGKVIPPGTAITPLVDLTAPCAEALAPIRQIMQEYPNGYALDASGSERLNRAMGPARTACGVTVWNRFNTEEFRGWLAPVPGVDPR